MQEKLKACRNSNLNFSRSCFIANYSHVKVVSLHLVVFREQDILHFCDNVHLSKYYPVKLIDLIILNAQMKPAYKFPNFRLH